MKGKLFKLLGVATERDLRRTARELGVSTTDLRYYSENGLIPSGKLLSKILNVLGISSVELRIQLGVLDRETRERISKHGKEIAKIISDSEEKVYDKPKLSFSTKLGELYEGDCISLLKSMDDDTVSVVFADPPFNLDKRYLSKMNDALDQSEYLSWCEQWLAECIRVLKPGGSLFLWNLPKWNSFLGGYLNDRLTFRHWIAVDMKFSLPISGKLYPSHYSLLYYSKGPKPNAFGPDRLPMDICKNCLSDLKDYGGYKDKMNPKGVNLTDVWVDIPPVRHKKYKKRPEANELSIKLMDRIIELSSVPGDLILDPFGGSGTTYVVAELKRRKWIGIELGPTKGIIERFGSISEEAEYLKTVRSNYNLLFSPLNKARRKKLGLWTDDTYRKSVPLQLSVYSQD